MGLNEDLGDRENVGNASLAARRAKELGATHQMHVYEFTDGAAKHFIAARNLEEATAEFVALFTSDPPQGVELTDAQLDSLQVAVLDEADGPTLANSTMRQQLTESLDHEGETEDAFYLCGEE